MSISRTRLYAALLAIVMLAAGGGATAQTSVTTPIPTPVFTSDVRAAAMRSETFVRRGPGQTYAAVLLLHAGEWVNIIERNHVGNWLHVARMGSDSALAVDGWVMTAQILLDSGLRLSDVPINVFAADADIGGFQDVRLARLYAVPVVSEVDDTMYAIYAQGRALGNRPQVVTKVGDSLSADRAYLGPMSRSDSDLGPYDYLADTVAYFGPTIVNNSAAAVPNMTAGDVLNPYRTDDGCQPYETLLRCEYRLMQPSIAFILFGANDVRRISSEEFNANMRAIVQQTLEHGIIPVLSTFSADPLADYGELSLNYNLVVVEIASDYDVPLINLWAAARELPGYGLESDNVHMTHSGYASLAFDAGQEALYGVSLRNLLSIYMLDQLRETLNMQ